MRSESSRITVEYLIVLLYFVLLIAEGVAEATWLRKKGWASWARSLVFAWLTNLLGFCIGSFLVLVSVGVTLALAWDGSMDKLPFHGNEVVVVLGLVVLLLPTLLALIKRLMLALLKMGKGKRPWLFAFVSSLVFWILPLCVTILIAKVFWMIFM